MFLMKDRKAASFKNRAVNADLSSLPKESPHMLSCREILTLQNLAQDVILKRTTGIVFLSFWRILRKNNPKLPQNKNNNNQPNQKNPYNFFS